ncbi:MAG: cysteine desulfurase family protein [Candidatus Neomarinimicrobiota bacterium]
MLYFDHSATTPVHPDVQNLLQEINRDHFGNPSSIHRYGQKTRALIEHARRQTAQAVGARSTEIIFTSGGTEANNQVLWNQLGSDRPHIITSTIEHPAVLTTVRRLEKLGVPCTVIATNHTGLVDPAAVAAAIRPDTGLVSIMLANNEIGTIEPLAAIAASTRPRGILLHSDAVQAVGKLPVNVADLGVDLLTVSGHKFYGPKGVGALYRRPGVVLRPLISGGGQEQNLRAGTENVAAIAGMGLAAELAADALEQTARHLRSLEQQFRELLTAAIPGLVFNGHPDQRLPGLVSVTFPRINNDVLIVSLDLAGMAVSNGSACSAGTVEPSHVLQAIGLSAAQNRQTLRISFGTGNSPTDVEQLVAKLVEIVRRTRRKN